MHGGMMEESIEGRKVLRARSKSDTKGSKMAEGMPGIEGKRKGNETGRKEGIIEDQPP